MDFDKKKCVFTYSDKIWALIITFLFFVNFEFELLPLTYVKKVFFLLYIQFKCVTSRLGQLHLIFHNFLTGLHVFLLINVKAWLAFC